MKATWTENSLLTEIVSDIYNKKGRNDLIEVTLKMLQENHIFRLEDWKKLSSFHKTKFPVGLVSELDIASGIGKPRTTEEGINFLKKFIKITSLEEVQKDVSSPYPFIEREAGKANLEECALQNIATFKKGLNEPTISQNVGFVIVSGGSGSGKTRACMEMLNILKKSGIEFTKNTCSIYFAFKNGDSLLAHETSPSQIAGLRIFAKGLCLNTVNSLPIELKNSLKDLYDLGVFEVSNILQLVGEVYHKLSHENVPIPLIIIMDEIQMTIDQFPTQKTYKDIPKSLAEYFYNTESKNENLARDKLIIIPVMSGTDDKLEFPLTQHTNFQFPLPALSSKGILTILNHVHIDMKWYDTKEKERFWNIIGMIPRSLEFGVEAVQNMNVDTLNIEDRLFSKVEKALNAKYGTLSTVYQDELFYFCFAGEPITKFKNQKWYEELYLKGIIYIDTNVDKLLLPYPYFKNLISSDVSGAPSNLFPALIAQFTWELFEHLINHILYHRMNGCKEIKHQREISVRDLFIGAYISRNLETKMVNVENITLEHAQQPFLKGEIENYELNHWEISKTNDTVVSKCIENHLLIDSIITDSVNKRLFLLQKKYFSKPKNIGEDKLDSGYPGKWFDQVSHIERFPIFEDYLVIKVFITNGNIPKKAKEIIENRQSCIIVDQSSSKLFFSPNILPYVSSVVEKSSE